ncbi:hypothetical protein ABK046_49155, partial [Streptomyces caeruleatus]
VPPNPNELTPTSVVVRQHCFEVNLKFSQFNAKASDRCANLFMLFIKKLGTVDVAQTECVTRRQAIKPDTTSV